MVQPGVGKAKAVLQCGSTSLTPAQVNYSVTELEFIAVLWGLQKPAFYTKGDPSVTVYSDHSALTTLCKKELIKVENNRIINILEKLSDYNYEVVHLAGSKNQVADFVSRHPVTEHGAPMFPKHRASVLVRTAKAQRLVKEDASIWSVLTKSKECSTTSTLIETVKKGVQIKELPESHPAR